MDYTATVTYGNDATDLDPWQTDANPWTVEFTTATGSASVHYWTGPAISEDPDPEEVLDCVRSDASYADEDLADFLVDMGYTDGGPDAVRSGIRAHQACQEIRDKMAATGLV
jgi:hypothetical protein